MDTFMTPLNKDKTDNKETKVDHLSTTSAPHYHVDKQGALHKCYHQCRRAVSDWGFWLGLTVGFPIEHFLYEKVFPFTLISQALGL